MDILEAIELRLYRFAQDIYKKPNYTEGAKQMALEILNLMTEHLNQMRQGKEDGR